MKIKIAVGISILAFFIIATATLASYFVIKERNEHNPNLLSDIKSENTSPAPSSEPSGLLVAKIAEHSSPTDCWITISGKVYNVTKFLDLHPGGGFTITPYCGKDATQAFSSKDRNPSQSHTQTAVEMLKQYYIGDVSSNVSKTTPLPLNTVSKFTVATTKPIIANPTNPPLTTSSVTLSTAEVSAHNTTSNCWLIISNNVYNVTNYLVAHPGGVSVIANYCGKEATLAFQTRGGSGSNHSSTAYSLLNNYLVGSIGSTITTSTNSTTSGSTSPTNGSTTPTLPPSNQSSSNVPSAVLSKYPNATLKSIEDDGRELEVNTSVGCRHIKLNSSGVIVSDQSC